MTEEINPEELLEFPCDYEFKAVGAAGDVFRQGIIDAVQQHVPVALNEVRCRPSGRDNYQAVSILVTLQNYQQLTGIYQTMKKVPGLKILL